MLKLKTNTGDKINCPNQWNELKLCQWIKMIEIVKENGLLDEKEEEENITEDIKLINKAEQDHTFLKTMRELFAFLIDKDIEYVNKIHSNDIEVIIESISNFLKGRPINENPISHFTFKGKRYFFPTMKMQHSTFEDYIEASQLEVTNKNLKAGNYAVLAEQIAILCREKGEEFDEMKIEKKKRLFKDLTMDVIWEFVFFLNKQTSTLKTTLQMYLNEK